MPLTSKERKRIASLLRKGSTYEQIMQEVGVPEDDVVSLAEEAWLREQFRFAFTMWKDLKKDAWGRYFLAELLHLYV